MDGPHPRWQYAVTALADACADYAAAVPLAQALTHIPDTDGSAGRGQPASRPPWNPAAATALLDALDGARQLEAAWRSQAAGRPVPRRAMAHTGAVLASLLRLAHAAEDGEEHQAVILLTRWTTAILQLPAVDREERPQRVEWPCPYCGFAMMRLYPRDGVVTCLRYGACLDSDGSHPRGRADWNRITGDAEIAWNDGLVT